MLTDTRIDRLNLPGIDGAYAAPIAKIGEQLTRQLALNMPLYSFREDALRYAGIRFIPTTIMTTAHSLVVTFEPEK